MTRPLENTSTAAGAIGEPSARSAADQTSFIDSCSKDTVASCSGFGKTLNDAATITPRVPMAP